VAAGAQALSEKRCVPCEGGVPPLDPAEVRHLLAQLDDDWRAVDGRRIECEYRFADFSSALAFVNRVGELAESEGHHPDILLGWGRARIILWTHAVDGLTENDFILASKIERLIA
jgi:4a-hydroxytetrahydrobiopterin dehydratase